MRINIVAIWFCLLPSPSYQPFSSVPSLDLVLTLGASVGTELVLGSLLKLGAGVGEELRLGSDDFEGAEVPAVAVGTKLILGCADPEGFELVLSSLLTVGDSVGSLLAVGAVVGEELRLGCDDVDVEGAGLPPDGALLIVGSRLMLGGAVGSADVDGSGLSLDSLFTVGAVVGEELRLG